MTGSDVTPSCGCVFCDLDIPADDAGYHVLNFGKGKLARAPSRIKCTLPEKDDPA